MDAIDDEEADMLVENHLISPVLLRNKHVSGALINRENNVSVMINEEDHLREQCIVKGLDLKLAYDTMSEIDATISKSLKFAYDEELGYLTACPTNLGTGLRASVMMFLPELTINGKMNRVISNVERLGLTVRGTFGEGSESLGYTYQISNEITLGVKEEDVLDQVTAVVLKVVEMEREERENLKLGADAVHIKDKCLRSLGILTNCALLSTREFEELSYSVKLGVCLGYIKVDDVSEIDDLITEMQPSNVNLLASRRLSALERDIYRAEHVSKRFRKMLGGL
jgi:protein arginine kinase